MGNFIDKTIRTHSARWCKNSGVNNIVPTHIKLLSRDSAAFSPSVSESYRFCSQQHVQITRKHKLHYHSERRFTAESREPCRRLRLSRDKICLLELSRLFSFTLHSTEISLTILSKLNKYKNPRSASHLEINECWDPFLFIFNIYIFTTLLFQMFSLFGCISCRYMSVGLRIGYTACSHENNRLKSFLLRFL